MNFKNKLSNDSSYTNLQDSPEMLMKDNENLIFINNKQSVSAGFQKDNQECIHQELSVFQRLLKTHDKMFLFVLFI